LVPVKPFHALDYYLMTPCSKDVCAKAMNNLLAGVMSLGLRAHLVGVKVQVGIAKRMTKRSATSTSEICPCCVMPLPKKPRKKS